MKKIETEATLGRDAALAAMPNKWTLTSRIVDNEGVATIMTVEMHARGTIADLRDMLEQIERDQTDNPGRCYKVFWESA